MGFGKKHEYRSSDGPFHPTICKKGEEVIKKLLQLGRRSCLTTLPAIQDVGWVTNEDSQSDDVGYKLGKRTISA